MPVTVRREPPAPAGSDFAPVERVDEPADELSEPRRWDDVGWVWLDGLPAELVGLSGRDGLLDDLPAELDDLLELDALDAADFDELADFEPLDDFDELADFEPLDDFDELDDFEPLDEFEDGREPPPLEPPPEWPEPPLSSAVVRLTEITVSDLGAGADDVAVTGAASIAANHTSTAPPTRPKAVNSARAPTSIAVRVHRMPAEAKDAI